MELSYPLSSEGPALTDNDIFSDSKCYKRDRFQSVVEVFSDNELIPLTKQGCTNRLRLSRNCMNYKPKGTGNWQGQLTDLKSGKKMINHETS